jgi:hypothetical protein
VPGPTGADLGACAGPPLAGRTVDTGPGVNGAIPVGERECLVPLEQISAHVQGLHWLGGLQILVLGLVVVAQQHGDVARQQLFVFNI